MESTKEPNPYLDSKREWVERYGDYIVQARNWRLATLSISIIAFIMALGLSISVTQNKIVPYIIEVDKLGKVAAVAPAIEYKQPDIRMIKSELAAFIEDVRSVSADNIVQKKALERIYAYLPKGSSASTYVQEYINAHNPFTVAQTSTKAVTINSVLQLSEKSWQIEWQEIARDLQGNLISNTKWKAALLVEFNPPTKEEAILANPLGLFITQLSWTQQL
jgi:type IV secretion system protein VirB5